MFSLHIIIYSIGKVIRLSDIDIFKFNHNLRLTNHRILLDHKLFSTIILTSKQKLYLGGQVSIK